MISGKIKYFNNEYNFRYDDFTLEVLELCLVFDEKELLREVPALTATIYDSKYKYIHFNMSGIKQASNMFTKFNINYHVLSHEENFSFSRVSFKLEEMNWIHNIGQAVESTTNLNNSDIKVSILHSKVTVLSYETNLLQRIELVEFDIDRTIKTKSTNSLSFSSQINFEIRSTTDHENIEYLYKLTKIFVMFCCYRKNHDYIQVCIKEKNQTNKFEIVGECCFRTTKTSYSEDSRTVSESIIPLHLLGSNIVNLLDYIQKNKLFIQHIPSSSYEMNQFTPARFIMITAAFEWIFKNAYGNIKEDNQNFITAKENSIKALENIQDNFTGKEKNILKDLRIYSAVYQLVYQKK